MKGGKGQRLKGGKPGGKMFLEMEKILNEMQRPETEAGWFFLDITKHKYQTKP